MNWEYQGDFLKQFNAWERNMVTQMVCRAYRGMPSVYVNATADAKTPATDLDHMLGRLDAEITERSAQSWISEELRLLLATLTTQMQSDELKEFCQFIAKREKRDPVDKQKAKEQHAKMYMQKAMKQKPPSIKQLELLKKLGVVAIPSSMQEASVLIDRELKR